MVIEISTAIIYTVVLLLVGYLCGKRDGRVKENYRVYKLIEQYQQELENKEYNKPRDTND